MIVAATTFNSTANELPDHYEMVDGRIVETTPMGAFEGGLASSLFVPVGAPGPKHLYHPSVHMGTTVATKTSRISDTVAVFSSHGRACRRIKPAIIQTTYLLLTTGRMAEGHGAIRCNTVTCEIDAAAKKTVSSTRQYS